jgi:DNA-directed RNA polymerase subunit F
VKTEEKKRESMEEWINIENKINNNKILQLNPQQTTKVQNIFKNKDKDFVKNLINIFGKEKYNSISNLLKKQLFQKIN